MRALAGGAALVALAAASVLAQFTAKSRLVEVYATVYDSKGNYVDGLTQDRFQIRDGGALQEVAAFESGSEELSCAILIDTTGSMQEALSATKNAVSMLLDKMREGDSAGIFGFNTSLATLQPFTTDKAAAKRAVLRLRAAGQTALFDAIVQVSGEIGPRKGKKAIVLFTDGADNASALHAEAAVQRALKTGVPIFAIGEGAAARDHALMKLLEKLAVQTGGLAYQAHSPHDVSRVFADIQNALKHVYLISYKPPMVEEGTWRPIQIAIAGMADAKIRGKQGYFPE